MVDTMEQKPNEDGGIAEDEVDNLPDSAFDYKLVGVLIHMGTHLAGHYLSYINVDNNHEETDPAWDKVDNQKWLEFNDDVIKQFNIKDLEE